MTLIKKISEMIEDEIEGAMCYAKKSAAWKEDNRKLADLMYTLAQEELTHISRLHDEVTKLIAQYRAESGEPPAAMLAVYDYLHKKHIDEVAEIKRYIDIYKNM